MRKKKKMLVKNLAWEIGNETDIKVGFFLQSVLMSFDNTTNIQSTLTQFG